MKERKKNPKARTVSPLIKLNTESKTPSKIQKEEEKEKKKKQNRIKIK